MNRDAQDRGEEPRRLAPDPLLDRGKVQVTPFQGGEQDGGREALGIVDDPLQDHLHRRAGSRVQGLGLEERSGPLQCAAFRDGRGFGP
jgi:hypothetical protein